MDAKRKRVIDLFLKNFKKADIIRRLKPENIGKMFIYRTIKRFQETGKYSIKPKTGRKRTVRTEKVIKQVRERFRRNPAQSARYVAKDMGLARTTMQLILKKDLGMTAYKKQKVHGLTEIQKKARVVKCRNILNWHDGDEIIFSDEKMFLLQDSHNQQNDRVYAKRLTDVPSNKLAVERYQNVSRVMVWGAISKRGKLPLLFIEKGVKVDTNYYIQHVLKDHLLPHATSLYGDDYYCFQQDSAPSHKSKRTQEWCERNLPDFIPAVEWPSASPDLNPLDFCIWGYMMSRLGSTKGLGIEKFKQRLVLIWDEMDQDIVRAACNSFFKRLRATAKGKGERIELLH
jgi:transposase